MCGRHGHSSNICFSLRLLIIKAFIMLFVDGHQKLLFGAGVDAAVWQPLPHALCDQYCTPNEKFSTESCAVFVDFLVPTIKTLSTVILLVCQLMCLQRQFKYLKHQFVFTSIQDDLPFQIGSILPSAGPPSSLRGRGHEWHGTGAHPEGVSAVGGGLPSRPLFRAACHRASNLTWNHHSRRYFLLVIPQIFTNSKSNNEIDFQK